MAALWGRLKNVELLLDFRADVQLECVRNKITVLAVDFARDLQINTETRSSCSDDGYSKDTLESADQRDQDRKKIVTLLESLSDIHRYTMGSFEFTRNMDQLTCTIEFELQNETKTIGVLYNSQPWSVVTAMSGGREQATHETNNRIPGEIWTDKALRLCEYIGYNLVPNITRDRGRTGRYNACHAEKQLIAFFIHENGLLPRETDETLGLEKMNLNEPSDQEHDRNESKRSPESSAPLTTPKRATIMVSRQPCEDCEDFTEWVNNFFKVDIRLVYRYRGYYCGFCP